MRDPDDHRACIDKRTRTIPIRVQNVKVVRDRRVVGELYEVMIRCNPDDVRHAQHKIAVDASKHGVLALIAGRHLVTFFGAMSNPFQNATTWLGGYDSASEATEVAQKFTERKP